MSDYEKAAQIVRQWTSGRVQKQNEIKSFWEPKEPAVSEFFKASDFASKPVEMKHAATLASAISCTTVFGPDFAEAAASIANRLLKERGTVVYGYELGDSGLTDQHRAGWSFHEAKVFPDGFKHDTHQALLIDIKPIEKPDTAESLLKELISAGQDTLISDPNIWHVIERAKKLLEKK